MSAMSDYLENKLVDHIFRGVSFTAPAALHVALFTAAPSDSGGGTEVSGGSYARAARPRARCLRARRSASWPSQAR